MTEQEKQELRQQMAQADADYEKAHTTMAEGYGQLGQQESALRRPQLRRLQTKKRI